MTTTVRRWLARAFARPEPFPEEYRAERLDQAWPLARPAGWHRAQQEGRAHYWVR